MDAATRPEGQLTDRAGFGALLLLLLANMVIVIALGESSTVTRISQLIVAAVSLGLAGVGARLFRSSLRWIGPLVVVLCTVAIFAVATDLEDVAPWATEVVSACLYVVAAIACAHRVLRRGAVTLSTVLGALSVYLLLAYAFSATFGAIQSATGNPFFSQVSADATVSDFLYFSLVTLTTLGYGDLTAAGSGGRAVSALEAVVGQVFLATFVARAVGAFGARTSRASSD